MIITQTTLQKYRGGFRESSDMKQLNEYALYIPRDYARGESNKRPTSQEEVKNIPHYELHITRQVGTVRNRRDTYVYLRLPKSKRLVNIILYMDGGVGFDKSMHKYIIRELDELDRRIILGYCLKYQETLRDACYEDKEEPDFWLASYTTDYRASDMPKRIKTGSWGVDFTEYYHDLKPYEEQGIFSNIRFI